MYRIEVVHQDPDHPNAEPAHVGPAFDESFREMARHFKDGEVDLLEEAIKFRDSCQADAEEGYTYQVVELVDMGDGEGAWNVVEGSA